MGESNFARLRRRCSGDEVEARLGSQAEQSRAEQSSVRRPGLAVILLVAGPARPQTKKPKPYLEPSQRRSPQKPGSGGLQVACFGP